MFQSNEAERSGRKGYCAGSRRSFEQTLAKASPDMLREAVRGFAQRMMDAEVESARGAGYGEGVGHPDRDDRAGDPAAAARIVLPPRSWSSITESGGRAITATWSPRPQDAQPRVSTVVRTIFEQPDSASVGAQVTAALEAKLPRAAAHLDAARDGILVGATRRLPQSQLPANGTRRTSDTNLTIEAIPALWHLRYSDGGNPGRRPAGIADAAIGGSVQQSGWFCGSTVTR